MMPCKFKKVCEATKVYDALAAIGGRRLFPGPDCEHCNMYEEEEKQDERSKEV